MSRFMGARYSMFDAYTPGEQPQDRRYIKLNTNESPYPPSPKVRQALNADEVEALRLYPDPECGALRASMAAQLGLDENQLLCGNGSDELLSFAFMAWGSRGAAFADVTYGLYRVLADLHQVKVTNVPLRDGFALDDRDYLGLNRLIVIANPNAPTGRILCLDEIETILKTNPKNLVVIDEAYIDFGGESAMGLIGGYDNLLVVCTYSKSRSMAGARLGFAMGAKAVIDDLVKIKYATNPYNVNALTAAAGLAALHEPGYYRENCRQIQETRRWTTEALTDLGFRVVPSATNVIFVTTDRIGGSELYQGLKQRKILIRHFDIPAIRQYNRITIGTRRQMELLVETIDRMLGDADDGAGPGIAASPDGEEQL